jgi:hypothetical protein
MTSITIMISKRGVSFGESPAKAHGIDLALIVASPKLAWSTRDERNFVHVAEIPSPSTSGLKDLNSAGIWLRLETWGGKLAANS